MVGSGRGGGGGCVWGGGEGEGVGTTCRTRRGRWWRCERTPRARHGQVRGAGGGGGGGGREGGGLRGGGAGRILRVKRSTEEGYEREGRSYKRVAAEVVSSEGQGVVLKGVEGWEVSLGYMPT